MFQFPTGWNSTWLLEADFEGVKLFQFPTGWNSTLSYPHRHRSYWRFNSQRDGILPKPFLKSASFANVFQFPTGWNSTEIEKQREVGKERFNSQRDGILLLSVWITTLIFYCFNSQRDGILRLNKYLDINDDDRVSIPNGMEFYWRS